MFKGVKVKDCCNGTFIEDFFDDQVVGEKKDEVFFNLQDKGKYGYFDDLASALMTLFGIMVSNQWQIMEGYAQEAGTIILSMSKIIIT